MTALKILRELKSYNFIYHSIEIDSKEPLIIYPWTAKIHTISIERLNAFEVTLIFTIFFLQYHRRAENYLLVNNLDYFQSCLTVNLEVLIHRFNIH